MNLKHTVLLLLIGLLACKQQVSKQLTVDTLLERSSNKADTIAKQKPAIDSDSVFKPYPGISYDPPYTYKIFVLLTGDFHGDEVPDNAADFKWSGVFKSDSGYYIAPTNIKVSVVKDEILDEDSNKTGKRVETANKDTAVILVSGKILKPGEINKMPVKSLVFPGEKQVFTFKGSTYTLSATGQKISGKNPELYTLTNYRLFLRGIKDGKLIKQLLLAQPGFDSKDPEIIFAGDLDGDDTPDFIIDTSDDYNVIITTLYLSTQASKEDLLKVVGYHLITGC